MTLHHYVFVNGEVLGMRYWSEARKYPAGTCTYSPTDSESDKWCQLTGEGTHWDSLEPEDVPPQFKVQLLLLGVPI